jgi:urease accessory protein
VNATTRSSDAQLDLSFARAPSGETYLARQYAGFPFHVTRSLRLDTEPAGMATVVLQSLGAGLLQGDRLAMAVEARAGAAAHVTTQGSTVAHGMAREGARQDARVVVGAGAFLEYLPRPMILFPDADVTTALEIVLHEGGSVMWCDGSLMHDPKKAEGRFRHLHAETALHDGEGKLLALDRFAIDGSVLEEAGVMAGHAVHASLGFAGPGADSALAASWRAALDGLDGVYGGVSGLPGEAGLFCRLLARDGVALRNATLALWRAMRLNRFGVEPGVRP